MASVRHYRNDGQALVELPIGSVANGSRACERLSAPADSVCRARRGLGVALLAMLVAPTVALADPTDELLTPRRRKHRGGRAQEKLSDRSGQGQCVQAGAGCQRKPA